jgi:hypothetical protein
MKLVVKTGEVPHLWAHKAQSEARNHQNSLYFRGDTIYSYGSHFAIARHARNAKDEPAILLTTRAHSATTARHCSQVRQAIPPNIPVFRVAMVVNTPAAADVTRIVREAARNLGRAKQARSQWVKDSCQGAAESLLTDAQAMSDFWQLGVTVSKPSELEDMAAKMAAVDKEQAKKTRERNKERIQRAQEELQRWQAGAQLSLFLPGTYARIEKQELVTNKGARIPLEHAVKAWPLIKFIIESGKSWTPNGHTIHLGHYAVNVIDADGSLRAGCHTFEKSEVLRIGAMLETCKTCI